MEIIPADRLRAKQVDKQRQNAAVQNRYLGVRNLPKVPVSPTHDNVETWQLPTVGGSNVNQHVQWEINKIHWETLTGMATDHDGDSIVWAMNVIAKLQAMWIEATDELEQMRRGA